MNELDFLAKMKRIVKQKTQITIDSIQRQSKTTTKNVNL